MLAPLNLTSSILGFLSLGTLFTAYVFVIAEEKTHFRKSKPVLMAAFLIWLFIAIAYHQTPESHLVNEAFRHNFLEYTEILIFLLVAMTFINVLDHLLVFEALRYWLIKKGWSQRKLFWVTGLFAFFISPVADNMTTALIMGAVVMAVGGNDKKFVTASCVNVVVAANAGGAFSPFGDITTLMVWQAEKVKFETFFYLLPSTLVTWFIPALLMSWGIKNTETTVTEEKRIHMRKGARRTILIFGTTIAMAVFGHNNFHMPPVFGMIGGLAVLKIFGYFLKIRSTEDSPFDVMRHIEKLEWDTLLFFGGIILAVGGIGFIGYLKLLSNLSYQEWGPFSHEGAITIANFGVGLLSAIIDNIPLMFAVLTMNPEMSQWQWLFVTLTAGTGGSLLSIGSAAGVALMGASKGLYTFNSHLKYTPTILIGYILAAFVHYGYAKMFVPTLFG